MTNNHQRNAEIITRRKAGEWPADIAAAMGLSRNTVIGVCYRAGLNDGNVDRSAIAQRFNNPARGENHGHSKLTEDDVRSIRRDYNRSSRVAGAKALARRYGVSGSTIGLVVEGRTWRHVG